MISYFIWSFVFIYSPLFTNVQFEVLDLCWLILSLNFFMVCPNIDLPRRACDLVDNAFTTHKCNDFLFSNIVFLKFQTTDTDS